MKLNAKKLHDRFNKKWIGYLFGYSVFFVFFSLGGFVGIAVGIRHGINSIYFFLLMLVISYVICLPIGLIRGYIRKNYEKEEGED